MTDQQHIDVVERAYRRAEHCESEARLLDAATESIRPYAYGADEFNDLTEDPEIIEVIDGIHKAQARMRKAAASIREQAKHLPGHAAYERQRAASVSEMMKDLPTSGDTPAFDDETAERYSA